MRGLFTLVPTVFLVGCALTGTNWMQEREVRAARAEAAGDFRPYPEGWPEGRMPLNGNPEIVSSIKIGQTMCEVGEIMGRRGSTSHRFTREEFLEHVRRSYDWDRHFRERVATQDPEIIPETAHALEKALPSDGQFTYWRYQGFPMSNNWILVFFAQSYAENEGEPRVIGRGLFHYPCL